MSQFQESVDDWDDEEVRRAIRSEFEDDYDRKEFLYLCGHEDVGNLSVCIVDLYAGACHGEEEARRMMSVFWKLYGIPMKYRPYTVGQAPWVDFILQPPSSPQ